MFIGLLLFLFAVSFAVLRVTTLSQMFGVPLRASWAMIDFKIQVYYPAVAFWNGANPYDGARYLSLYPAPQGFGPYLPGIFLAYVLFSLMPVGVSGLVYFFLTIALTVALAFTALKLNQVEVSNASVLWVAALILLSRPGQWNLLLGQVAAQTCSRRMSPLLCSPLSACERAGVGSNYAKAELWTPLAVLMLARRDKRAVLFGAAVTATINLPLTAVLVHRAGGIRALGEQLISTQQAFTTFPDYDLRPV